MSNHSIACLYCPHRRPRVAHVRIAGHRGVCNACMFYIRHHSLSEARLVKRGLLLPPQSQTMAQLWERAR